MNVNFFLSGNLVAFVFLLIVNESVSFTDASTTKRFEYKLSFKGPHLTFKDGTVPFWEHSGSTICSNDQIRLTPSIRSQKGRIWSANTMPNNNWEIEVTLRVNGRGRVGADGMAIWYTDRKGSEGDVFGSNDKWNGLGIFLDSFDNDAQQNNPYILIMTNDGTKVYDHHRDGITQQLGGCLRDFRNKPFPIALKIEYYKRTLSVYYHNGLSQNDMTYPEICARIENVDLPQNGHFGVSAATGGLADDQDVLSFVTYSLVDNKNQGQQQGQLPTEEQKKYDAEYAEFLKQLEVEKEKYNKEHPEKHEQEIDEKKNFESESDRQFRTILDIQNSIHHSIRSLDGKFAEVIGRQERIVSMIGSQMTQPQGQQQQQQNHQQAGNIDTFNRMEVNQVMAQQTELVRTVRDLQNAVIDIQQKANHISQNTRNAGQQPQQAQQPQINPSQLQNIADDIKNFRFEVNNAMRVNKPMCPAAPSCLSTSYFIMIIAAQSILFIVYFIYKSRSETQMKKFY